MDAPMTGALDDAPVLAAEQRRREAVCANDTDVLDHLITDDFVYIHSTGFSEGKAAYLDRMRKGVARYVRLDTRDVSVRRHGACAIVDGVVDLGYERSDGVSGVVTALFMAVWVETDGAWRLAGYGSTPLVS
jgi:ketosteroid isomerase-like protein